MLSSAELALNNKDYLFFSFVFGLINSTRSFSFYSLAMAKIAMYFSMCQNAKGRGEVMHYNFFKPTFYNHLLF